MSFKLLDKPHSLGFWVEFLGHVLRFSALRGGLQPRWVVGAGRARIPLIAAYTPIILKSKAMTTGISEV